MKNLLKNGSLIACPARFAIALVSFYLAFSPPLYALTPEQVSTMSTAEKFVYTAYAKALAYFPDRVANGLQRRLALWAYDPAGNSVYGTFNITIGAGNTVIGNSTLWNSSPYVNGPPKPCGYYTLSLQGVSGGYGDGNETCQSVDWTRGSVGSFPNSYECQEFKADHRPQGAVYTNSCGAYSASCILGGYGVSWPSARFGGGTSWIATGSGFITHYRMVNNCLPSIPIDEFSTWLSAPISNAILGDTADIIKTLQDAKAVTDLTVQDQSDINAALTYLHQGVPVNNGAIPSVVNSSPNDIWDFTDSGTIIGGGGGNVVVSSSVTNINVDFSTVTAAVNKISDFLVNSDTSAATSHYNAIQTAFQGLLITISSMPVMGALNQLLPQDTTSQWEPCFDLSFAWAGPFAGHRPAAYTGVYCLSSFAGWDPFVSLVRWGFSLAVMVWGVRYLWGGY